MSQKKVALADLSSQGEVKGGPGPLAYAGAAAAGFAIGAAAGAVVLAAGVGMAVVGAAMNEGSDEDKEQKKGVKIAPGT